MNELSKYIALESISGKFYVDERGIMYHFEPSIIMIMLLRRLSVNIIISSIHISL